MPLISVIVPVYNVEKYIHRCVDSILSQTFRDFELILVDDGSPDNCGAICDDYAEKDSRVVVIHQQNGGLSSARNAGLDIAVGEYILFCDSDDYVSPDWCESFARKASGEEKNYIFGGIKTVKISETEGLTVVEPMVAKDSFLVSDYLELQTKGVLGFAWNVLYYASIISRYGLRFSKEVIVEDLPFNLIYLRYMNSLAYTGSAGYYYINDCRETLSRKYYPEIFRKWQEKYQATQAFVDEVVPVELREDSRRLVADNYLYLFLQALNNTFDKRNTKSLVDKIKYNMRVVGSADFQHCLQYANCAKEDPRVIRLLKQKNYIAVYLLERAAQMKQRVFGRSKVL